jgi:hypothetical protein
MQSKVAIYVVSFNYSLEKVIGFTRIPLRSVTSIQKGAYILSPLQEAGRDPVEVCCPAENNADCRIPASLSTFLLKTSRLVIVPTLSGTKSRNLL